MIISPNSSLRRQALFSVTLSGCLAMVYVVGVTSPPFVEFMRSLGANEFHFGLLGGIPLVMYLMQFAGALLTNHLRFRKTVFVWTIIAGRLVYVPVALLPSILPNVDPAHLIPIMIALLAFGAALSNLSVPLWYSWMADLIPKRILNRYWGTRQRWMHAVWAVSYVLITLFTAVVKLPAQTTYAIFVTAAVTAGVIDILIFLGIPEPPNRVVSGRVPLLTILLEPLRDAQYRGFVIFSCSFAIATYLASSFMQLYILQELHVPLWQTTLIWCMLGAGVAVSAKTWGRIADQHGHRPVLILCVALKPCIAFVFLTITPATVIPVLPIAFFFDSMLNAGTMVATNGYIMKIAPQRNRSMFVAAITGLSGIAGGLSAIVGGMLLRTLDTWHWEFMGRTWGHFHVLFLTSVLLRLCCTPLAMRIREPQSSHTQQVLLDIRGVWPLQYLRFPTGFYRHGNGQSSGRTDSDSEGH